MDYAALRALTAVEDVTLSVASGHSSSWAEGSAKSTTIKNAHGLLEPSAGSVEILGLFGASALI